MGTAYTRQEAKLSIGSRFSRYDPEQEKMVRKVEVKEDKVVTQFREAWEKYKPRYLWPKHPGSYIYEYNGALEATKGLSLSPEEIKKICIALAEFQGDRDFSKKAGYLLSALINSGKARRYEVIAKHLSERIVCLGFRNTKKILIEGNGSDGIGREMKKGKIVVRGDAGDGIGCEMTGGRIIVLGNAGNDVGTSMKRGQIQVEGNAGDSLGHMMKGGKITVRGNTGVNLGDKMSGGVIKVNGEIASFIGGQRIWFNDHTENGLGLIGGGRIYLKGVRLPRVCEI